MTDIRTQLAHIIAPHLEGYCAFNLMPKNRLALRLKARAGNCGTNDATQDDAYELADLIMALIDDQPPAPRFKAQSDGDGWKNNFSPAFCA